MTRITVERHVRAPREVTWRVLLTAVANDPTVDGTVVTVEPPWRHVTDHEGGHGLELCQGTFSLRDDGDESHLAWCLVAEPDERAADVVEGLVTAVEDLCDRVVAAAEALPTPEA